MLWGTFCGPGANILLWVQMVGSYELVVVLRKWNGTNNVLELFVSFHFLLKFA